MFGISSGESNQQSYSLKLGTKVQVKNGTQTQTFARSNGSSPSSHPTDIRQRAASARREVLSKAQEVPQTELWHREYHGVCWGRRQMPHPHSILTHWQDNIAWHLGDRDEQAVGSRRASREHRERLRSHDSLASFDLGLSSSHKRA